MWFAVVLAVEVYLLIVVMFDHSVRVVDVVMVNIDRKFDFILNGHKSRLFQGWELFRR